MKKMKMLTAACLLTLTIGTSSINGGMIVDAATNLKNSLLIASDNQLTTVVESNVSYTVMSDYQLPTGLQSMITSRREYSYSTTYSDGDDLYLVVSYGARNTGGYSVSVESVYETDDSIKVVTKLNTPSSGSLVTCAFTYPHAVIKIENTQKTIEFDMGSYVSNNPLILESM